MCRAQSQGRQRLTNEGALEEVGGDTLVRAAGGRGVMHYGTRDVHRAWVRRWRAANAVEAGLQPRRDAAEEGSCML